MTGERQTEKGNKNKKTNEDKRRKEMKMKNNLLAGAALIMAAFSFNEAQATSCAVPPSCSQLGYTKKKADCGEYPVLRCPFALSDDNQVYCLTTTDVPPGDTPTQEVAMGAIVYGDGTVSKTIISGKTPIGVVFDETNRLALALTDVKKNGTAGSETMLWLNNSYDISALPNCQYSDNDSSVDSCSVDGRSNTTLILNCGSGCNGTPAATAVNSYEPTGCTKDFCKKTKWFLPSVRDLAGMYSYKNQIDASLTLLNSAGAVTLGTKPYWSSTEYNGNYAWKFYMYGGYRLWNDKNGTNGYVRPVVEF